MGERKRTAQSKSRQGQELEGVRSLLWYVFLLMIRERLERTKNERGQGESRLGDLVGGTKLCGLKSVVCSEMCWASLFSLLSICYRVSYLKMGTASPERAFTLRPSARHM